MVRSSKKILGFIIASVLLVNMMVCAFADAGETPTVNLEEAVILDVSGLVPTQTETPTPDATASPTPGTDEQPTVEPTKAATEVPTETPAVVVTQAPTEVPTETPTEIPTETPVETPTEDVIGTAEPAVTPAPTQEDQPTEAPTETPTPEPTQAPERKVITECIMDSVMCEGDEFVLKATLVGFENLNVKVQWQYDLGDEKGFRNAEGASNELIFRVKANETTLNATWRIVVTIVE